LENKIKSQNAVMKSNDNGKLYYQRFKFLVKLSLDLFRKKVTKMVCFENLIKGDKSPLILSLSSSISHIGFICGNVETIRSGQSILHNGIPENRPLPIAER